MVRKLGTAILCAACLATVLLASAPAVGAAQSGGPRIDVRRGYEGLTRGYSPNPLTVVVETDRFFGGWIEVIAPNASNLDTRYRQPLELPAGSRKTVVMVTPRSSIREVWAVDNKGRRIARAQVPGEQVLRNDPLVGLLSADVPRVTTVEIPIVARAAKVTPVSPTFLSLGAPALTALSHLVVDGALLPTFSPQQRAAIVSYAGDGGEVIVAASSDEDLSGLPRLTDAPAEQVRAARVGNGNITAVMAPLADAGWDAGGRWWRTSLAPVDLARWNDQERTSLLGQSLRESGGFQRPTLGWLLFFVLAYVALVGPVNFMVLSRLRKRELAWITIPAIGLIFAAGAYVAGLGFRRGPVMHGVALRVFNGAVEQTEVSIGAAARRGNSAAITLRGTWVAEPGAAVSATQEGQRVEFGRDQLVARFDLTTGEVGTIVAHQTRPTEAVSAGSLTVEGGEYTGTVTNPTGWELTDVQVFAGPARDILSDSLLPGGDAPVVLDARNADGRAFRFDRGFDGGFEGPFPPDAFPGAISTTLLRRAAQVAGVGHSGGAFLTGWADLEGAASDLGLERTEGKMLVVLPVELDGGDAAPAGTVGAVMVDTDGQAQVEGADFGFPGGGAAVQDARSMTLRFRLNGDARPDRMRLQVDQANGFGGGQVFIAGREGVLRKRLRAVPVKPPVAAQEDPENPPTFEPIEPPAIQVAPDAIPGQPGYTAEAWDHEGARWVSLEAVNGVVTFDTNGKRRFLTDPGEIFIRIRSDFSALLAPSMFILEGVTS